MITSTMQAPAMAFPAATASYFDRRMGRQPSKVPAHLSRVLYIPRHDTDTLHLPIYEARDRYCNAVRDHRMGSTLFTTMLGFMERPQGNDMRDQVEYLATMKEPEKTLSRIHLDRREPGTRSPGVDVYDCCLNPNTLNPMLILKRSGSSHRALKTSHQSLWPSQIQWRWQYTPHTRYQIR